jgi:hypothetical protein
MNIISALPTYLKSYAQAVDKGVDNPATFSVDKVVDNFALPRERVSPVPGYLRPTTKPTSKPIANPTNVP